MLSPISVETFTPPRSKNAIRMVTPGRVRRSAPTPRRAPDGGPRWRRRSPLLVQQPKQQVQLAPRSSSTGPHSKRTGAKKCATLDVGKRKQMMAQRVKAVMHSGTGGGDGETQAARGERIYIFIQSCVSDDCPHSFPFDRHAAQARQKHPEPLLHPIPSNVLMAHNS